MDIQDQLKELYKLKNLLTKCLADEDYALFAKKQEIFSKKVATLLDTNSPETLTTVIEQLHFLEGSLSELQELSKEHFIKLKEARLQQSRSKKKINAYK